MNESFILSLKKSIKDWSDPLAAGLIALTFFLSFILVGGEGLAVNFLSPILEVEMPCFVSGITTLNGSVFWLICSDEPTGFVIDVEGNILNIYNISDFGDTFKSLDISRNSKLVLFSELTQRAFVTDTNFNLQRCGPPGGGSLFDQIYCTNSTHPFTSHSFVPVSSLSSGASASGYFISLGYLSGGYHALICGYPDFSRNCHSGPSSPFRTLPNYGLDSGKGTDKVSFYPGSLISILGWDRTIIYTYQYACITSSFHTIKEYNLIDDVGLLDIITIDHENFFGVGGGKFFHFTLGVNCTDGTPYGECSTTQPLYCFNGTLINKCSLCDCPPGYDCQPEENCEITPPEPSDERRPIFASFYILLLIILFIIFFALSGSFSKSMATSLGCLLTIIVLPPVVNTLSAQMDIQLIIYIFIGVVLSTLAAIHRILKNKEGE